MPLDHPLTVVGANNSGKTNLLRAIEMLFTGHDNELGYDREHDLTFNVSNAKTSLLATFQGTGGAVHAEDDPEAALIIGPADTDTRTPPSPLVDGPQSPKPRQADGTESASGGASVAAADDSDRAFYEGLDRLYALYGRTRTDDQVSLSLVFAPSGTPVYQFFPNLKKPTDNASQAQISRVQRQLVTELLGKFSCHYIPSAKSIQQLYDEVLNPFLRSVAARAVAPQLVRLSEALDEVADGINDELAAVGLGSLNASFALPDGRIESLLSRFDFNMEDPHQTPIARKGQGIQSTAFLAALRWVTREESKAGQQSIWLLEEPESYLHPELMGTVQRLLRRLSDEATVVTSTHSLAFVPGNVAEVIGTSLDTDGRTEVHTYPSALKAGESLRAALGVRFSDYYNLGTYNIAVEGVTDLELLGWYLATVPESEAGLPLLRQALIQDFGGVKHLAGWLRATYPHIREERALVSVFDGDSAGEKERKDLVHYLGGQNIPFQPNQQYVIVRAGHAIEGLFPDEWLTALNAAHPNWFDDFAVDASGALQSLRIKDHNKRQAITWLQTRSIDEANNDWRGRFDAVAGAIDAALAFQHKHCSPSSSASH